MRGPKRLEIRRSLQLPLEEEIRQQKTDQAEHCHDLNGHALGGPRRLLLLLLRLPLLRFLTLVCRRGLTLPQAAGHLIPERGDRRFCLGQLLLELLVRLCRGRLDGRRYVGRGCGGVRGCLGRLGRFGLISVVVGNGGCVLKDGSVILRGGVGGRRGVRGSVEL